MSETFFVSLVQNIALLLSFSMLYDYFWSRFSFKKLLIPGIAAGLLLGGIGIMLILTPWTLSPGLIFDTRTIMLSVAGLFLGPIPTITAMLATAAYRFGIGGEGMYMGLATIFTSGTIGLIWRRVFPEWDSRNTTFHLLLMGLFVHLIMLSCTLFLPAGSRLETLDNIFLPVLLIYPVTTVLLGHLMLFQRRNQNNRKELEDSELRWKFALEGAGDGVYDWNPEKDEVYFSPQYKAMLGYRDADFPNKSDEWERRIHPEDRERVKETLNQYLKGLLSEYQSEYRLLHRKGHYIWVLARGKIVSTAIDGTPLRMLGTHTDITRQKEDEVARRIAEMRYGSLLENMTDGYLMMSLDGHFMEFNKAFVSMLGYQTFQLKRFTVKDITPPQWHVTEDSIINGKTLRQGFSGVYEKEFVRADGSVFPVELNLFLVRDAGGKAVGLWGIVRDITQRKRASLELLKMQEDLEIKVAQRTRELELRSRELAENEMALINLIEDLNLKTEELERRTNELDQANKELEAFTYTVSHDLRAPLRAINGFTGMLSEDYSTYLDEKGLHICDVISENTKRMGQLIDDLLAFSRLSRSDLNPASIDMKRIAEATFREAAPGELADRITFVCDDLDEAHADPAMMKQVWMNLISNAVKFSSKKDHPRIEISSISFPEKIEYEIKDNGAGFDMQFSSKLFGVFQRLHTIKEFDGTGVGLAIVKRIIERHGGSIKAVGKPGEGAVFTFSLPVLFHQESL